MDTFNIFIETGKKKTFAGALAWPGWCRYGKTEETAVSSLLNYGARYAQVMQANNIPFTPPADPSAFTISAQVTGNSSTDFGAPAILLDADREPVDEAAFAHLRAILLASWQALDAAVQQAEGHELRKGPRGGGRDVVKMLDHVLDADKSYLAKIGRKYKPESGQTQAQALAAMHHVILEMLDIAMSDGLPERGPRGGVMWPLRYYIRRSVWHTLDHAWEIEDRVLLAGV